MTMPDDTPDSRPSGTSRPATTSWQDAATAPRSGAHILVTRLGEKGFGHFAGQAQDWCAVVHYWDVAGEEGFYLSSGASADIDDRPVAFTHWMPLPQPVRESA